VTICYVPFVQKTKYPAQKPDTFSFERTAAWVHSRRNLWETESEGNPGNFIWFSNAFPSQSAFGPIGAG